ncbi:MAG: TatD family deoxyribonuclease [Thermoprotei archaeon]|nr:MAG: TatD family deoxyribonuclease [Thermoprotei archaeon]
MNNHEEYCYVDVHCHCYEYSLDYLQKHKDFIIVIVSDDVESSIKTIEYAQKLDNIVPCVGIHPWSIEEAKISDIETISRLIDKYNVKCIGEVGLDTKFVPKTIDKQREFFNKFLQLAKEYDLVMNIHAAGTWNEVLDLLIKNSIEKAIIHWYTGPPNLIDEIASQGYYIGVNPAWKIQKKHREIISLAPISILITESDAPYNYRGLKMEPRMVVDSIKYIGEVKKLHYDDVVKRISNNFRNLFKI